MNFSGFGILCISMTAAMGHAAELKPAAAGSTAEDSATVTPAASVSAAESARAEESLPDVPGKEPQARSFQAIWKDRIALAAGSPRVGFTTQQGTGEQGTGEQGTGQQGTGVRPLASLPLAGVARRLGAQRFNTDDGSLLDDFAICYRMSVRSSIEIIPGDPAPVKLPVISMANSVGVTVGLVYRLLK